MTFAVDMEMDAAPSECETQEPMRLDLPLEVQHERLLALAADLILENQQMSGKVKRLEVELAEARRGLKAANAWAGMLF